MPRRPLTPVPAGFYDRPVRARIKINLAELAIERGLTVPHGPYKGHANAQAIIRGTGLGYQTVWPILRTPDKLTSLSFDTILRLCQFLRCDVGDLLTIESAPELPSETLSDQYLADGMTNLSGDGHERPLQGW